MKIGNWFVYHLYSETKELLYVGIAQDVEKRVRQHIRQKSWGAEIADHTVVATAETKQRAQGIENELIRRSRPKYNVMHNHAEEVPTVGGPLTSWERFARWYAEFAMKHWYSFLFCMHDDGQLVEIPFFALEPKNFSVFSWMSKDGKKSIEVRPGPNGRATIHDKDVLLYLLSKVVNGERSGRRKSGNRSFRIDVHNYFMSTQKMAGPGAHARLIIALNRLRDTVVVSKEKTEKIVAQREFGIIESWVVTDSDSSQVPITVEITVSDWVFQEFRSGKLFEIPYGYFQARSPVVRRIHELAGPHFAEIGSWTISLTDLLKMANPTNERVSWGFPWGTLYASQILPGFRVNLDSINNIIRLRPKYS